MAQPAASNDRLPWLSEVPRTPPPAPTEKWKFPWGAVLIGLAFAFVAVAGYILGTRKSATDAVPGPEAPLEQPYEAPSPSSEIAGENVASSVDAVEPSAEAPVVEEERPRPKQEATASAQPRPRARPRAVAVPEVTPTPVIIQPVVRGRIIQLGAFPTPSEAETAWQKLVRKWPYLATKPKLVSPIDVRSTDGKATRMHRLQLATASQAQSVVICQQLEKSRQSCVVVY